MILRICELGAFSVFGVCSMMSSLTAENTEPFLQFGALGLVGFMIIQNYRQNRETTKVVERKDIQIESHNARMAVLLAEDTDAKNRLAEALGDRPCLKDDQRIKEN